MKPSMCKLCGKAHWAFEDHYTGNSAITPDYIRDMAAGAMGYEKVIVTFPDPNPPETVTTVASTSVTKRRDEKNNVTPDTINVTPKQMEEDIKEGRTTLTRGRPKKHKDAAARQRAYRERSK